MEGFAVGDEVVVRFGTQMGQKGIVLKSQPANVYTVKVEDGTVLFFSAKGLEKQEVQRTVR